MARYYWRMLTDTGLTERLLMSEMEGLTELIALRTVDKWNRQSAAYCNGRFLYWLD